MTAGPPAIDISVEAALFVRDHGGVLFIWTQRQVWRGRISWRTQMSSKEPGHLSFQRVFDSEQVEIYLAGGLTPREVTVALKTFPRRRVVAFWPGCMYQ
jgi:hypothetical protein